MTEIIPGVGMHKMVNGSSGSTGKKELAENKHLAILIKGISKRHRSYLESSQCPKLVEFSSTIFYIISQRTR